MVVTNASMTASTTSASTTVAPTGNATLERFRCRLPQVVGGIHDVLVWKPGQGHSNPRAFENVITVSSFSPSDVSVYGGGQIVIQGEGFAMPAGSPASESWGFTTKLFSGYSVSYDGSENTGNYRNGGRFGNPDFANTCVKQHEPFCSAKAWYQRRSPIRDYEVISANWTTVVARVHGGYDKDPPLN